MSRKSLPLHQTLDHEFPIEYKNVIDLFTCQKEKKPSKIFVNFPGEQDIVFSYALFHSSFTKVSNFLLKLGLKQYDRINIIFSNSAEFLLFYFAGLSIGVTIVPINPDLEKEEIYYIIKDSCSKAVFFEKSVEQKLNPIKTPSFVEPILFCVSSLDEMINDHLIILESKLTVNFEVSLTDEAVIIYTSGTTGNPKGVVLSHLNLLADAKAISDWFDFSEKTVTLCVLPLFHNNGQITTLLAPLYAGGSTVIVKGKSSLLAFWKLVLDYEVNWTSVMSSILSIILSLPYDRKDKTLAGILCGGQVLTRSVQSQFEKRFNVPIFEGYGLTETTSFSCINDFPADKRRPGSIGHPLNCNKMAIMDENCNKLESNQEGEICIKGYNVAIEYLDLPNKNKSSFKEGWFHSGDYGFIDEEGYFFFNGRKDSLIIKGGENIYPAELENIIYKHPEVDECAVIGIPDKLLGEEICAFVDCKEAEITGEEIIIFCRGKIASYKLPKFVFLINVLSNLSEIPKGPTKKVLYRELLDYYSNYLNGSN